MSYLLDTMVISEWAKSSPDPNVVAWLGHQDEAQLFLSVATIAELRRRTERLPLGRRRQTIETWLRDDLSERFRHRTIPIDIEIAEMWGILAARVANAGRTVGPMDVFFAATATVHGLTLVTRAVRDFVAFDVPLLNPWSSAPS